MWYVYAIRSLSHPFLYVGSTNDIDRRLREHNKGQSLSTAPCKPFSLLVCIGFPDKHRARTLEKYFKTGSGRTILKKRILNDEDLAEHDILAEDVTQASVRSEA